MVSQTMGLTGYLKNGRGVVFLVVGWLGMGLRGGNGSGVVLGGLYLLGNLDKGPFD